MCKIFVNMNIFLGRISVSVKGPQDDLRHNKGKNCYLRFNKNEDFRPVKTPVKIALFNAFYPIKNKLANNSQKLLFPYTSYYFFLIVAWLFSFQVMMKNYTLN